MRGVEHCDCGHKSSNPFYLMRTNQDEPDEIKATFCEKCANNLVDKSDD